MAFRFYHAFSDNFLRTLPGVQQLSGPRQDTLTLDPSAFAIFQLYDTPAVKRSVANAVKELEKKRRQSRQHTREEE